MPKPIIPYNPKLKPLARQLRKQGTAGEILLWKQVQRKSFGVEFHRQVPLLEYIVDFYCHELKLVLEIDGLTHDFDGAELKDRARQERLETYGITFLRFSDAEIKKQMNNVVQLIEDKVAELKSYI